MCLIVCMNHCHDDSEDSTREGSWYIRKEWVRIVFMCTSTVNKKTLGKTADVRKKEKEGKRMFSLNTQARRERKKRKDMPEKKDTRKSSICMCLVAPHFKFNDASSRAQNLVALFLPLDQLPPIEHILHFAL